MALQKVNKFLLSIGVLTLFFSCDSQQVYDQYQSINQGNWHAKDSIAFTVAIKDNTMPYDVFLNIRNDKNYAFRNLYVISKIKLPNQAIIQDTLEYEMADAFGNWLGTGLTDVKNNSLYFLEKHHFKKTGVYKFVFYQAMRKREEIKGVQVLQGITDVGLRVVKSKKK